MSIDVHRRVRSNATSPGSRPATRASSARWPRDCAAALLTLVVFPGATEGVTAGAALLGFGLGWAMLHVLSGRTDRPQPWAPYPRSRWRRPVQPWWLSRLRTTR